MRRSILRNSRALTSHRCDDTDLIQPAKKKNVEKNRGKHTQQGHVLEKIHNETQAASRYVLESSLSARKTVMQWTCFWPDHNVQRHECDRLRIRT